LPEKKTARLAHRTVTKAKKTAKKPKTFGRYRLPVAYTGRDIFML
jgi:hypothetical protein